jgi:hypothetical protein
MGPEEPDSFCKKRCLSILLINFPVFTFRILTFRCYTCILISLPCPQTTFRNSFQYCYIAMNVCVIFERPSSFGKIKVSHVVLDGCELVSFTLQPLNPPPRRGVSSICCGLRPSLGVVLKVKIPSLWNQTLVIQLFRLQEI